jgi:molybdopterin converting factor small subunit
VVRLRLFGFLERLAGHRETSIEMGDDATLLDVLSDLAERYGAEFAAAIFRAPHEVQTHLRLFMNDKQAEVNDLITPDVSGETEVLVLVLNSIEGGSR